VIKRFELFPARQGLFFVLPLPQWSIQGATASSAAPRPVGAAVRKVGTSAGITFLAQECRMNRTYFGVSLIRSADAD